MRSSREQAVRARDCRLRRPALLLSRAWTPPSPSSCLEAPAPPAADRPVQLFVLAGLHPRQVGAQHSLDAPPRSSSSCWALSRPATYSTPEPVTRGRAGLSLARPELCMRVPASCSSTCDTAPRPASGLYPQLACPSPSPSVPSAAYMGVEGCRGQGQTRNVAVPSLAHAAAFLRASTGQ